VSWWREFSDGGFQVGEGGVGDRAVGLPQNETVRICEEHVGIVGAGETNSGFPFGFVIIDGQEVRMLRGGDVAADAVEDHGANERRGALELSHFVKGDMGVGGVIGSDAFGPSSAEWAAFVRETDDDEEELRGAGLGEGHFRIVESFSFDGRDRLPGSRDEDCSGQERSC